MDKRLHHTKRAHLNTYVPSLFVIVTTSSLVVDAFFPRPMYTFSWAFELGLVSMIVGTLFVYTAHLGSKKIRSNINTSPESVNFFVGPYAYIRHPGYLGMVLIGIGMSLVINSVIILVTTVLFYMVARMVAGIEETRLLHEDSHLRDEYAEYTKKVSRYF